MVGRGAEPALLLEVVDLDDRAVGVVVERVALGLEAAAVGDDGVDVGAALGARVGREAALAERLQALPVRVELRRLEDADVMPGSFCLTAPAAALRGLANVVSPASSSLALSFAKASRGM